MRLPGTAPLGERQVLLTATKRGGPQRLRILGPDGRVQHIFDLPGLTHGAIHDASPTGDALVLDGSGAFAYAVDPETGEAVRHDLDVHADGWFAPQVPGMLAVHSGRASVPQRPGPARRRTADRRLRPRHGQAAAGRPRPYELQEPSLGRSAPPQFSTRQDDLFGP